MPSRIVTSTYRYKRPPQKRKAVALEVPAIVRGSRKREVSHAAILPEPANDDRKPVIITITEDVATSAHVSDPRRLPMLPRW